MHQFLIISLHLAFIYTFICTYLHLLHLLIRNTMSSHVHLLPTPFSGHHVGSLISGMVGGPITPWTLAS